MAAWYLLHDSSFDSSHPYTEIYLNSIFSYLDSSRVNARVVPVGHDNFVLFNMYQHSLYRSSALEGFLMRKLTREREFRRYKGIIGSATTCKALASHSNHP